MKRLVLACMAALFAAWLGGCGGGAGSNSTAGRATTGRAVFTVRWPQRTRLIPAAANSILVIVSQGNNPVGRKLLPRPANGANSSVTFDPLPIGTLSVAATAFPNADGSGTAQATATIPLAIQASQTTNFTLTMNSTIDHLELTAPRLTLGVGVAEQLAVAAKDATGAVVLLTPSKLNWSSSNKAAATVDTNGKVTGIAAGNTDISVTDTESGKSAKVTLLIKLFGPPSFQQGATYPVTGPNHIVTGDFDGDGKTDVAVGTSAGVVVFWGNGDGTFTGPQTAATWTGGMTAWSAADMNGDGLSDLVCTVDSQAVVIESLPGRQFASPIAIPMNAPVGPLTTGDFNGDGRPDIAIVTGNPGSTANDIHILKNNGNGTFTQVTTFRNIWIILFMKAADLNGDGKQDLLVSITTDIVGASGANIYWGDGTGHFTSGPGVSTATFNTNDTCVGDFYNDGNLSFAIGNFNDGSVSVVRNTGSGNFGTPATYLTNGAPEHIATADVNGDGLPDIVVGNAHANFLTVMPNQNGLFSNLLTFPISSPCGPIAIGDFNGDGKPDVVISSPDGNSIVIMLNNSQ